MPAPFHPVVARWFADRVGSPTPVQAEAWPVIARGDHVLATAPTGSGKTLTAFLWALNQLCTGQWPAGRLAMVYVSPLKALGNDVRKNLLGPLHEIADRLRAAGLPAPEIRALVRTGDTPPADRQKMLRRPPEILVTTPESLNLLLLSRAGRQVLAHARCLVLDEIHAVVPVRRGTYLMTAVERLDRLTGGHLQRIALSATVQPLHEVARFVGGLQAVGPDALEPRPVTIVAPPSRKVLDVRVIDPARSAMEGADPERFWPATVRAVREIVDHRRSTLVFTRSRRSAEKLARMLNDDQPEPVAWAHHGSLSKDLRLAVEQKLKAGEIKALCATSSLELGIDVGELEEVVLVQAPMSLASFVQRVGRAGHQVGAVSRGTCIPLHGHDLLAFAVMAPKVKAGEIEPLRPLDAPLDVLAQVILAMCCTEPWLEDELFDFLRTCWSYRNLSRLAFDLVLDMLQGRYASARLPGLVPRLRKDERSGFLEARPGVRVLLARSGGVIADRGYFDLRVEGTGAKIGELDEEFVWERHIGDAFALGAQTWRVTAITHDRVEVAPVRGAALAPFWRAESEDRNFLLSEAIGLWLAEIEPRLGQASLPDQLAADGVIDPAAARDLVAWLKAQKAATGGLPHRHRVVIEECHGRDQPGRLVLVHAPWGRQVLRPLALALDALVRQTFGVSWQIQASDDCLALQPLAGANVREVLDGLAGAAVEALLQERLGSSGFFGARFREAAGCALLLPRRAAGKRVPLWLTRQRSRRLLQAVQPFGDFPIVAETWRTCLEDAFDLPALRRVLGEWQSGSLEVLEAHTEKPSPFAEPVIWSVVNTAMYEDDTPETERGTPLAERVLREVARRDDLRPRVAPATVAQLEGRLQRTAPDWAPSDPADLLDHLRERVAVPDDRWQAVLAAMERDHGLTVAQVQAALGDRVAMLQPGSQPLWVAVAELPAVQALTAEGTAARRWDGQRLDVQPDPKAAQGLLQAWTRGFGPLPVDQVAVLWGWPAETTQRHLEALVRAGAGVLDQLVVGLEERCYCDLANLERLLRLERIARRGGFTALPVQDLALFRADWHGLCAPESDMAGLQRAVQRLFGLPLPAASWETDVLPARLQPYQPAWLDALAQEADLCFWGAGEGQVAWGPRGALEVLVEAREPDSVAVELLPDPSARYAFDGLLRRTGQDPAVLTQTLWELVWAGQLCGDSPASLRQGLQHEFAWPAGVGRPNLRTARAAVGGRTWPGTWSRVDVLAPADAVQAAERDHERVRQLLDRHGVLFREALAHEPPALQWRRLLPALRQLELAGELVSGQFFQGIHGLQFTTPAALRRMRRLEDQTERVWTCAAVDPASCCGLGLEGLDLPPRLASTHLVYVGSRLVAVVRRGGRHLELRLAPTDPRAETVAETLARLAVRPGQKPWTVETIGDDAAFRSPWRPLLRAVGFEDDVKTLVMVRRYAGPAAP